MQKMGGDASLLAKMAKQLEEANTADGRHSGRTANGETGTLQAAYP